MNVDEPYGRRDKQNSWLSGVCGSILPFLLDDGGKVSLQPSAISIQFIVCDYDKAKAVGCHYLWSEGAFVINSWSKMTPIM